MESGKKTVLLCGAAGFIGFSLAERLLKDGVQVVGFDSLNDYYDVHLKEQRLSRLMAQRGFTFIKGSLEDKRSLEQIRTHQTPSMQFLQFPAGSNFKKLPIAL